MGTGLRIRDDRSVDSDAFDWLTPAEELEVPVHDARALYEEALRRAMYPGSRPAEELYLEWLADRDPEEPEADPGRRALTMRLGGPPRRERARGARVPGKHPLTAHLGGPAPRPAEEPDAPGPGADPASLVDHVRRAGDRLDLPFLPELEAQLGTSLDFVEAYTGEAARTACQLMAAGAFAVRNVVAFADPSPQREVLLHELAHVIQMGGRAARAPRRFAPGSLSVGSEHSAAEHDADAAAWGARIGVSANPQVVHRTTNPPQQWTLAAAQARWSVYETRHTKRGAGDRFAFATPGAEYWRLYSNTSAAPFQLDAYWRVVGNGLPKEAVQRDLSELAGTLGLHRVLRDTGDGVASAPDASRRYAWISPAEAPADPVFYLRDQEPRNPSYNQIWASYCAAVAHLQTAGGIAGFTTITLGTTPYPTNQLTQRSAYTEPECQTFRHALRDAIVADQRYHWQPGTHWQTFRDEISTSGLPTAIIGDLFTRILEEDFRTHQAQLVSTSGGGAVTVTAGQTYFVDDRLTTGHARGDGFIAQGGRILESKAGGSPPGDDDDAANQARDYARIILHQIPGVTSGDPTPRVFSSCAYTFTTPELARAWAPEIVRLFEAEGLTPADNYLAFFPPVDGFATFQLQVNPTFDVALRDRNATQHRIENPFLHPGIRVHQLDIQTARPGSGEVVSGTATIEVETDGAVESEPITKTLTPEAGAGGMPGARMENALPGVRTGLDQIFERLETEARLTDDGVEATIRVTAGPSGIPNLELDEATVTVRYSGAGALEVTGSIGVHHTSGQLSGRITLGYAAGQWSFTGEATIAAGMIEGLSAVTARVSYEDGRWTIGVDQAQYEKQFGAVGVTGTAYGLRYDVDTGQFSGHCSIEADLGAFGKARAEATLEENRLQRATLSYDSPELRYPPGSESPVIQGTIGGDVTFEDGRFSGSFRGNAALKIPGLSRFTEGGEGLGLAVDGQINSEGNFAGTIRSTRAILFGDHFRVPTLAATLAEDGSISAEFALELVNVRYVENARIDCAIDRDGFRVTQANVRVPFGTENETRFWGELGVTYVAGTGLTVEGDVSCKIKEGMVARGRLVYSTETNQVTVTLGIDDIQLLRYGPQRRNLFELRRQIPIATFWSLIGIYLDFGFTLEFEYEMDLSMRPTFTLENLSLETLEYDRLEAEVQLLGQVVARLIGTPTIGLGVYAGDPRLIRGGGGLQIPITAEAAIRPTGTFRIAYTPDGGVEGGAQIGLSLTFGITGSVRPYAEFSVLDGAYNPTWTGDTLASFEIMPPKELFNYVIDLAGDMTTEDNPEIPSELSAPAPAAADHQFGSAADASAGGGAATPAPAASRDQAPASGGAAEERPPEEPANFGGMTDLLKQLPGYQTASRIMSKAAEVWSSIRDFFGQVLTAFGSWIEQLGDAFEEILDGFAREGLGYVRTLLRRVIGEDLYYVLEPLVDAVAGTGEQIMSLFEEPVPQSLGEFFPWALRIAQRVWGIAFGSIGELVSAVETILSRIGEGAARLITYMVNQGMIGVRRHSYYIPIINHKFLAATQYKIHVLGIDHEFQEGGIIINPQSVVASAFFDVLERMNVPPTNMAIDPHTGEPFRDRWQ